VQKLTVARTARYAVCGTAPEETERVWVVFHGYATIAADFIAPFAKVLPAGTRVIAPEGLSRFYVRMPVPDGSHLKQTGATWLTRDDREDELRDALAMLQAVVAREHAAIMAARPGRPPRVGVLGFSQGVAMSMRWVVTAADNPSLSQAGMVKPGGAPTTADAPATIATHVLWAGGLAHDVDNAALRDAWRGTALHLVVGDRDGFATDESSRAAMQSPGSGPLASRPRQHAFGGGHRLHTPLLARPCSISCSASCSASCGASCGASRGGMLQRRCWRPPRQ
jgi:predicted esterase